MKKKDLTYLNIDSVGQVVTNADTKDIPQTYAIDARGVSLDKEGMVLKRMFGTKKVYDNVPTVPATGTQVGGYRFYDKDTNTEYDIVITTDSTGTAYARVYVNDSTLDSSNVGTTNDWIELTRTFTAVMNATPGLAETTFVVKTVKDSLGNAYNSGTFNNDEVNYWICYNTKQSKAVLITDTEGNTLTTPNYPGTGVGFAADDNLVFFRTNWLFNTFQKTDDSAWSGTEINLSLGATPHNRWLGVEAQRKVNLALGSSDNPPVMKNLQRIQLNAAKPLFCSSVTPTWLLTLPANWDVETIGGIGTYTATAKGSAGTPITATVSTETVSILNDTNDSGVAGASFMSLIYNVTHTALAGSKEVHLRIAVTLEYDGYQESDPVYRGYFQSPADTIPAFVIASIGINPASMPKHLTAINFYCATHNNDLTGVEWTDSDADYSLVYSIPINSAQYNDWGVLTNYTAAGLHWANNPTSQYAYLLTLGTAVLSLGSGAAFSVGEISIAIPDPGTSLNVGDIIGLIGGDGTATVQVTAKGGVALLETIASIILYNPGTSGYTCGNYQTHDLVTETHYNLWVAVTSLAVKYNTSTNGTLAGRLAHATDINRSLVKPRYLVKSARNQAAIQVVDEDETTLRLTCYNGSGVHEDDNLPDITADSNNNAQLIALNGRGIMCGLAIRNDVITVFRSTEAETFDLQNGSQSIFDIDFLAKDSLVKSPYGLTWAGRTGIWWMNEHSGIIKLINSQWVNKYNGSLMIDDGTTQYMTDAYRTLIVSGYDPYTKAVIFSYQINKHDTGSEYMTASYEFEKDRWSFKVLGGSLQSKYFAQTTRVNSTDSAKLIIGTTTSLLLFPNLTGSFPYTDAETAASTIGSGFDTDITINIKDLYNQVQSSNLVCFLLDYIGSSTDGTGVVSVEFYANDELTPFDTQYLAIDRIGEWRNIGEWGNIDSLRVRIAIVGSTSALLANVKKFDVSRLVLGFKKKI